MISRRILLAAGLVLVAVATMPAVAAANSPWWHLTSSARPTYLKAGLAQNEVQKITVAATGGNVVVVEPISLEEAEAGTGEPKFAIFEFNAEAAVAQAALEGAYGAGNVEVSGGPGDAGGANPYSVTFTGALADRPLALMNTAFSSAFGLEGRAAVAEVSSGRPDAQLVLTVANLGDANAGGKTTPVKIADTLPPGLEAVGVEALAGRKGEDGPVSCSLGSPNSLSCTFAGALPPYDQIEVLVSVLVKSGHTGEANQLAVTGGGAPAAQISRPITVSEVPTPYGIQNLELSPEEEGGTPATQAGSHPFQLTTTFTLNQLYGAKPAALAKNLNFRWPAGLIGNPTPLQRCSLAQFLAVTGLETFNQCSAQSAVGVALISIEEPLLSGSPTVPYTFTVPVFNLEPSFGEPARFGFLLPGTPVLIEPSIRAGNGEDYGITVSSLNTSQTSGFISAQVTVWGTPGDSRHDNSRGEGCIRDVRGEDTFPCPTTEEKHPPAFLTLPTSCSGAPLQTSVLANSWAQPGVFLPPFSADPPMPTLVGCNKLPFKPTIAAEPTSDAATSPTGLNFDLNVEDEGLTNAEGDAQSQIKKAVVTLPEGFTTNPSVAEGLHACSLAQYESETLNSEPGTGCPESSKIGDVEIESPLVAQKIHGSLFVAKQNDNGFPSPSLLALYIVAKSPELGVMVRSAGRVVPNLVTGQLTTTFDNLPQLPFSRFHLSFRQGQRSPLITPPTCGNYTVKADLYPWSNPSVPLQRESSFAINGGGPEGTPCPSGGVPPFHPNLLAGTTNNAAGTYSPFTTKITRKDSEQEITHFSIKLPPGVIGKLAGVSECSDAAIAAAKAREHEGGGQEELNSPSCPANSEVGHSLVGSGVGNVLAYAPGKLYLAGPYHGSNLSIVSITAAKVGPFDLGTVVVREALKVNPETAQVSVDAAGSDPIPHIVDGIPVHLRDIRAYVSRPEFTLNPTSCEKKSTASTLLGSGLDFVSAADDQPVTVTSPFQAADCASLGFAPKLALSLKGKTNRGAHPAFKAVLTYPKGSDANIARSVVALPHSEFLANAHIRTVCTRVQFNAGAGNGSQCPAGSVYGHAKAITPLLDEPLEGPVYLRSSEHKLPDLVAALHNKQVDFDLDGRIDSVNNGQIRNTFETVPDAPVSKFVLEMQGGSKGLLENSTDLCASKHKATSEFTGQNGKLYDTRPVLQAKCGKGKKGKGHKRHR